MLAPASIVALESACAVDGCFGSRDLRSIRSCERFDPELSQNVIKNRTDAVSKGMYRNIRERVEKDAQTSSTHLETFEDGVHEGGLGEIVSSRIVFLLGDRNGLDDAVFRDHNAPLRSSYEPFILGSWMDKLHSQRTRQFSSGIGVKIDHIVFLDSLIFRPSLHDGPVVDAENHHLFDSLLFQSILFRFVVGNLSRGSGGCKGSGETQ